jgi:hypothetical protein
VTVGAGRRLVRADLGGADPVGTLLGPGGASGEDDLVSRVEESVEDALGEDGVGEEWAGAFRPRR